MFTWIDSLFWIVSLLVSIPVAVFGVECFCALLPARRWCCARNVETCGRSMGGVGRPAPSALPASTAALALEAADWPVRSAVVIPAHNEETSIAETVGALLPFLDPSDRLIVVADNCTDATAQLARSAGAEALERHDPERRGKGYALNHAFRFLESNPPDVVVVIDADCRLVRGTVATLARTAVTESRPVQALNLANQEVAGDSLGAISELAFRFKNLVRPTGLARLGMPCQLMGTGMALPWRLLKQTDLQGAHLAEDMQLGVDLAIAGSPALFCDKVAVQSGLPGDRPAFLTQRRRWEQGHLRTSFRNVPRLLAASLRQRRLDLFVLALDLCVPPVSLLVAMLVVFSAFCTAGWLLGTSAGPAGMCLIGLLTMSSLFLICGHRYCPDLLTGRLLVGLPLYVARKLPIYLAFFLGKSERNWLRTRRGGEVPNAEYGVRNVQRERPNSHAVIHLPQVCSERIPAVNVPKNRQPSKPAGRAGWAGRGTTNGATLRPRPATRPRQERVSLFGLTIDALRMSDAVAELLRLVVARDGHCRYVVTPNVDHVLLYQRDDRLRVAYQDAALVLADGMPIVWASRLLGQSLPERVAGSDLVPALFSAAESARPLRVYLLGAAPGVAQKAAERIHAQWPAVQVVGTDSPPFGFENDLRANLKIIDRIEATAPDVLVIGLGAPKQELWIHRWHEHIHAPLALCVGATIDFLAGEVQRAPRWMQHFGLEWLHRLATDPRRLAKRYLRDAMIFPQLVLRELSLTRPHVRNFANRPPLQNVSILPVRGIVRSGRASGSRRTDGETDLLSPESERHVQPLQ